jgi:hypothetical protein
MFMNIYDLMLNIISIIIGSLITWFFSWKYYRKAGKELLAEAKELRKLMNCMIILQQNNQGLYLPILDEESKLITIKGMLSGTIHSKPTEKSNLNNKK